MPSSPDSEFVVRFAEIVWKLRPLFGSIAELSTHCQELDPNYVQQAKTLGQEIYTAFLVKRGTSIAVGFMAALALLEGIVGNWQNEIKKSDCPAEASTTQMPKEWVN